MLSKIQIQYCSVLLCFEVTLSNVTLLLITAQLQIITALFCFKTEQIGHRCTLDYCLVLIVMTLNVPWRRGGWGTGLITCIPSNRRTMSLIESMPLICTLRQRACKCS